MEQPRHPRIGDLFAAPPDLGPATRLGERGRDPASPETRPPRTVAFPIVEGMGSLSPPPGPERGDTRSTETPEFPADSVGVHRRFRRLFDVWEGETCFYSFPHQIYRHRAYRQIVNLGEPAIPYMLGEVRRGHRGIVAALRSVSGESPVAASVPTTDGIADAWMAWGTAKGYVPAIA